MTAPTVTLVLLVANGVEAITLVVQTTVETAWAWELDPEVVEEAIPTGWIEEIEGYQFEEVDWGEEEAMETIDTMMPMETEVEEVSLAEVEAEESRELVHHLSSVEGVLLPRGETAEDPEAEEVSCRLIL